MNPGKVSPLNEQSNVFPETPARATAEPLPPVASRSTGGPVSVRVLRTPVELESIRASWESWQISSNADFDHYALVCRLRPEVESPFITLVERGGQPCALLLGRLERTHFQPQVGYLSPVRIPARVIRILHQGFLGAVDDSVARAVVRHLQSLLQTGGADAIAFHNLAERSPLWSALHADGPRWLCERSPRWVKHYALALAAEPGFILQKLKSKHRSWMKKKDKELETDFAGRMTWRWLRDFEDLPGLCARLEAVAALTYQRGLGAGFVNDDDHRQRLALFATRGQLRVKLLEIDGQARAFWLGVVYRDLFDSWSTGYDPALRSYEVGTTMFLRMVDDLVLEGVRRLDFGLGEAFYKERFGDESWTEATVHMFASSAKGLLLRSTLGLSSVLDRVGRKVLREAGAVDRLKTFWRRRLSTGSTAAGEKE